MYKYYSGRTTLQELQIMKNALSDTMPRSEIQVGDQVYTQITSGFSTRKDAHAWVKGTISPDKADYVIKHEYSVYIKYKGAPVSRPIASSADLQNILGQGSLDQVQPVQQPPQQTLSMGSRMGGSLYGGKRVRL